MVKLKGQVEPLFHQQVQEVCLDPKHPCARTYNDRDIFEQVTVPEANPSLAQMVLTGNVATMPGNSPHYKYPDLGNDEEAHEHPDYEKLDKMDPVDKHNFTEEWLNKPENYEQQTEEVEVAQGDKQPQEKEPSTEGSNKN